MSLFKLFERRSIESPTYPLTSASLLSLLGGPTTDAGVSVTEHSSLTMSTVWRATALISGLGGALPLHVFEKPSRDKVDSDLLTNPHPEMTAYEFWKLTFVHRCLWGNSYSQKIYNGAGEIVELHPIRPERVRVGRARPIQDNKSGKVFKIEDDHGQHHELTTREVLHIPGLGYDGLCGVSPIRMASQGIGLALAAESYAAKLFGSGNMLSGLLQTEQRLDQEQAETLQKRWQEKFAGLDRAHTVAVLDSGAQFQSLTMPNDDAQLLESRRFQIAEIARYFGVPPYLLMETEKSTSWGTSLEQQATGFVQFDLYPTWLVPTEQRITKELLLPDSQFAKYNVDALLRGDAASRAEFYRVMRDVGAFSANDIRELEDRPPVPDGDGYLQSLNHAPLGTDVTKLQKNSEGNGDASQPAND